MVKSAPVETAQSALRATGARVTQPRVQVLATLLGTDRALSHHEIEQSLAGQSIDRVTVYRVLDWLVGQSLAHRISGQDRIWRFSALDERRGNHAHFQCVRCGMVICLADVPEQRVKLPGGYTFEHAELTVTGNCADCAAA
jgi:Fur family ferric uptake transcriptional regulator